MDANAIAARAIEFGAMQKQDELEQLLEVLQPRRVRRVLEIGCFMGGTLYAWTQLGAEVFGVDVDPRVSFDDHGARVLIADSHQPATYLELQSLAGDVDFLFLDGDHRYAGVQRDFFWYRRLVAPGGLIGFHDIVVSPDPALEVWRLWRELEGPRREILTRPKNWGGIGLLEV